MRHLVHIHRHSQRKAPRIVISQEEITADLQYPVGSRQVRQEIVAAHRVGHR